MGSVFVTQDDRTVKGFMGKEFSQSNRVRKRFSEFPGS